MSAVKRGAKPIPLKSIVDDALKLAKRDGIEVKHVVCIDNPHGGPKEKVPWVPERDQWWSEAVSFQAKQADVEWVGAQPSLASPTNSPPLSSGPQHSALSDPLSPASPQTPRTPSSCSTPAGPRASPRGWSTPPAATWHGPQPAPAASPAFSLSLCALSLARPPRR